MQAEGCSLLVLTERNELAERLRSFLRAFSLSPKLVASAILPPAAESHDVIVVDAVSANGNLAALIFDLRQRSVCPPEIIVLDLQEDARVRFASPEPFVPCLFDASIHPVTVIRAVQAAEQRRTLAGALARSEERYDRLLSSVTDYTYTLRIKGERPVSSLHSPGCAAVTGYSPAEYEADPHLWYRMIHPSDQQSVLEMTAQFREGRVPPPLEHRILHKDGSVRWIRNTPSPRYDGQGRLASVDGLVTDITARKQAERELLRTNRALQALSQCNQALMRATDEAQLLDRVCRIIIDIGGYRMCWVGAAEESADRPIVPRAWAGHEDGYLATLSPSWSSGPRGSGPCGIAVRTSRPVVIRNVAAEPADAFWQPEAVRRGYSSLVVLPLSLRTGPSGMLAIYATEPDVFDDDEVKHLRDLADDLAYGMQSLRTREEHRHTEAALRESEEKRRQEFLHLEQAKQEWEVTFDSISDPIFIHDRECRIIRANRAYQDITGLSFTELIGKHFYEVFPRLDDSSLRAWLGDEEEGEKNPYYVEEFAVPTLRRIFRGRVYPVQDAVGSVVYTVQVLEDVTEMKKAEECMRQEMEVSANLLNLAESATDALDPDRLLERVLDCCARILSADFFLYYGWDGAARLLRPGRHTPLPIELVPMFRTEQLSGDSAISRETLENRKTCVARQRSESVEPAAFLLGPLDEARTPQPVPRPLPWLQDVRTLIAIPLLGRTDRLGLLVGCYRKDRVFSERDRRIAAGISREVSLALDEACLYRTALERSMELAHKMETLKVIHEIDLSILSNLEPQGILETAVRNIRRILPCDIAEAMLTGPDREQLTRIGADAGREGRLLLRTSATAAAEVLATCRPSYQADISRAGALPPEEERLRAAGVRSLFRVPLLSKGTSVGVLSVASSRPAAFTPENFSTLEQLAGLIGVALENTRLFTDLQELLLGTVKSLSYAIDAKSSWTAGHSERVTRYALQLGRELGMREPSLRDLELAGLLHDIGKLGTFDAILDKKSVLSREEFEIIKRHPLHGAELLAPIKQMQQIIPAVRHHHERFDGKGYPDGLRGEQIPDLARILAVADAFDSMTGWRPYRKTFDILEAVSELKRCSGTQFDPGLAAKFITLVSRKDLKIAS